jgi:NADPH-dependent 7-cyano-7-deazaguanine reductase QueF-like protein
MDFEAGIKYQSRSWNNAYKISLLNKKHPSIKISKLKIINHSSSKISHKSFLIPKKKI